MKKRTSLALIAAAFTASSNAAVIFSDNFSGLVGDNLHGTTTDVGSKTWTANGNFKANGSYSVNSTTADFGAALDLGSTFFADQLALGNNKVILTVTFGATGNNNSFAFAGFSTDTWISTANGDSDSNFNVGARAQAQGLTVALRRDTIGAVSSSLFRDTTAGDGITDVDLLMSNTIASSYTLTLEAIGSYANSTITLTDGIDTASITGYDASALRTFFLGVEATTGTSTANFDSVRLEAIPEPSAALLGSVGMLLLLRRRR